MRRGPIGLLIVSAMVLAAGAVFLMSPRLLDQILPSAIGDFVAGLSGAASDGTRRPRAGDTAADFLDDTLDGLQAMGPIAAHSGNQPVFISDAVSGYSTAVSTAIPSEITTIRPILGCMPTPPMAGTVVGHATSGQTGLTLALSTYNHSHLARAVQAFVQAYRKTGEVPSVIEAAPAYAAHDVAVTETQAPVYLVLENGPGNRIWNLHLAEGAQIERVVLLGGDQAGIANLDPVVPVEVILNDGLAACGIRPAYALNPGHQLFQPSQTAGDAAAKVAAIRESAAAYDIWFRDSFGVLAGQSRVGYDRGSVSVIGPLPGAQDPKAVYAAIAGSKIRTTQDLFFEIQGQVAEGRDFASRVKSIATDFAFGDLSTLQQGVDF